MNELAMKIRSPAPAAASFTQAINTSFVIGGICSSIVLTMSRTKKEQYLEAGRRIDTKRMGAQFGAVPAAAHPWPKERAGSRIATVPKKGVRMRELVLAGSFSVADILMADVLRLVDRFDGLTKYPACHDYVARATERPAFRKAFTVIPPICLVCE